jgi:hypothetical protein
MVNITGVDLVGKFSGVFVFILFSPFAVIWVWALVTGKMNPMDWVQMPPKLSEVDWVLYTNTILWAYGGFSIFFIFLLQSVLIGSSDK